MVMWANIPSYGIYHVAYLQQASLYFIVSQQASQVTI